MYDEEIPNNSFNLFGTEAREHEGEDGEPVETRGVMKESYEGETHDYLVKLVRTEIADFDTGTYAYPYQYTYTHRHFVGKFIGLN